jgi:repressor LexA
MKTLTEKQQNVFDFMVKFFKKNHRLPVCREICEAFGYKSLNAPVEHLKLIEKKGLLKKSGTYYKFANVKISVQFN